MSLKWSALQVSEVMDITEIYVNQIREPLQKAREAVQESRAIPDIPGYVDKYLERILSEIDRIIGGSGYNPEGQLIAAIMLVRASLPSETMVKDRKKYSSRKRLSA